MVKFIAIGLVLAVVAFSVKGFRGVSAMWHRGSDHPSAAKVEVVRAVPVAAKRVGPKDGDVIHVTLRAGCRGYLDSFERGAFVEGRFNSLGYVTFARSAGSNGYVAAVRLRDGGQVTVKADLGDIPDTKPDPVDKLPKSVGGLASLMPAFSKPAEVK